MTSTNDRRTLVAEEIKAMQRIVHVLEQVDTGAQDRIAGWLFDRYRIPLEEEEREAIGAGAEAPTADIDANT